MTKLMRLIAVCTALLGLFLGDAHAATDNQSVIEARFQSGLQSAGRGDYGNAIVIFQSILSNYPNLTRVRLELARAYFLAEQWNRSRSEFFKVLSGDIPAPVRQTILNFIRAIDARRGFEWDFELSFKKLGTTRDYDTDQIDLDFSGITLPATLNRPDDSTYGIGYSGSVLWRKSIDSLSNNKRLVIGFAEGFSFGDLADDKAFRDVTFGARGGARFVFSNTTAVVSPIISTRYLADKHFEDRFGLETSFERRNLDAYSVFGSLAGYKLENKFDDTFSGHSSNARLGLRRSFGGKSTIGVAVYGETKSTDRDIDTYTIAGLEAFGSFDVAAGLVIEPRIYIAQKSFDDANPLFIGDPDEDQYGARVRVEKRDLIFGNGFVPFVEAEYNNVKSGIDAFSYDETLLNIGITKAF